jgi:hypothetical protein
MITVPFHSCATKAKTLLAWNDSVAARELRQRACQVHKLSSEAGANGSKQGRGVWKLFSADTFVSREDAFEGAEALGEGSLDISEPWRMLDGISIIAGEG